MILGVLALSLIVITKGIILIPVIGVAIFLGVRKHRQKLGSQQQPQIPYCPPQGELRQRRQISRQDKALVFQRDGGRCRQCGLTEHDSRARYGEPLHYDHIIPFSRNGADTVANLQLLCGPCNRAKGAS